MKQREIKETKKLIADLIEVLPRVPADKKKETIEFIEVKTAELSRYDFHTFMRYMSPEIMPDDFVDGVHLHLFAHKLEEVYEAAFKGKKENTNKYKKKLQMMLPPGSMKSLTLNLFVCWVFGRRPDARILHIGASSTFAEDNFGTRIRDVMKSTRYARVFPETKVKYDRKDFIKTTKGGEYYCCGAGTSIVGRRAHISICDDVISEQTADSRTERTKICEWYVPGLRSRLLTGGCEVVVNTRWHLDDISGYIIALDLKAKVQNWDIVRIPAFLDAASSELLGLPEGSSFWPELWPDDALEEKRRTNNPQKWAALYMQNPIMDDGAIFKEKHFQLWGADSDSQVELPQMNYIVVAMDTAFSKDTRADYSAITVWGQFELDVTDFTGKKTTVSKLMLLDCKKGRWDFGELNKEAKDIYEAWKPDIMIIEKKASGQSLIQELRKLGYPVHEYLPDRDKQTRAVAASPFFDNGSVYVDYSDPDFRDEIDEFVLEMTQFPHANHDDYVDTATMAVLYFRDRYLVGEERYGQFDEDEDKPVVAKKTYWSR